MCERKMITIDLKTSDWANVQAQLNISFLGDAHIYWLKNGNELSIPKKTILYTYLAQYHGPHYIILFIQEAPAGHNILSLPETVDHASFITVYNFLHDAPFLDQQFIHALYAHHNTILLEKACLLMDYHAVLGKQQGAFCTKWLNLIVPATKSLFTLSQFFFALQANAFFKEWQRVHHDYPDEFWISFWSEQLWQATVFLTALAQKKSLIDAKKTVTRLPFSFIQKDWNRHSIKSLVNAHNFLYSIDYGLKNGSSENALELFLYKFLNNAYS